MDGPNARQEGMLGSGMMDECTTAPERTDRNWLILDYPANPRIRLDALILDRVFANDDELALEVHGVVAIFTVIGGADTARTIATELSPYTRSSPITTPEAYTDAKRRVIALTAGRRPWEPEALFFGDDLVWAQGGVVYIGQFACWLSDVERYALHQAALPLPNGAIQAALPLLLVAHKLQGDDLRELSLRIADYEMRIAR